MDADGQYSISLRDDARRALDEAECISGYPFRFQGISSENYPVHASVHLARPGQPFHEVSYSTRYQRLLDYMAAHEAGHIVRIYRAPPEQRLLSGIQGSQRSGSSPSLSPRCLPSRGDYRIY